MQLTGLRAAPYARISREDVGNVDNTAIQVDEALDFIGREGMQHVATFVDDNISAYSERAHRKDYERLVRFIENNNLDVIVVTEPSRLNRRLRNSMRLFHLAYSTDLKYIAVTDPKQPSFDLSTHTGIQNAISAAIQAEKESINTSARQKRKQKVLAKKGRRNGGPRPYGFEDDGVTIRKSEAVIIREIAKRLLNGESSRSIVLDLRRRGIKTPTGKKWHGYTIRRIMESPRICGIRTHLGVHYPAQWEAIISREDWERLQIVWRARAIHGSVETHRYLLTGIVTCGNCDTPMIGKNYHDTRSGRMYRRYYCPKDPAYHSQPGCGTVYRVAEPIDLLVSEAVLRRLGSPRLAQALGAQASNDGLKAKIDERQDKRNHKQELLEDRAKGILSRSEYEYAKRIVDDELEAINRRLATMQGGRSSSRISLGGTLRQVWQEADADLKRGLIKILVQKVVVLPGRTQRVFQINGRTFRFDPSLIRIVWKA